MRTRTRDLDPTIWDENGCLKDGATYRVPLTMRDSVDDDAPLDPGELARRLQLLDAERRRRGPVVTDASGDSLLGLRKPGFRYLTGGSHREQRDRERLQDARAKAYANYLSDLEGSWRTPTANTGAQQFATPQAGNPCSKDGWAGTWQDDGDGNMVCVIDSRATGDSTGRSLSQLVKDRAAIMEPIYESYAREISQAWKTK